MNLTNKFSCNGLANYLIYEKKIAAAVVICCCVGGFVRNRKNSLEKWGSFFRTGTRAVTK
jgi:hypothetical protein